MTRKDVETPSLTSAHQTPCPFEPTACQARRVPPLAKVSFSVSRAVGDGAVHRGGEGGDALRRGPDPLPGEGRGVGLSCRPTLPRGAVGGLEAVRLRLPGGGGGDGHTEDTLPLRGAEGDEAGVVGGGAVGGRRVVGRRRRDGGVRGLVDDEQAGARRDEDGRGRTREVGQRSAPAAVGGQVDDLHPPGQSLGARTDLCRLRERLVGDVLHERHERPADELVVLGRPRRIVMTVGHRGLLLLGRSVSWRAGPDRGAVGP